MKQTKNLCQGTAFHKHKVPQKEQRQENNAAWWCNLNRKLLQSVFKTWMTLQLVTVTTPALNSPSRSSTAAPHVGKEVLTLSSCSCTIPSISAGLWLPLHLSKILAFVPFLAITGTEIESRTTDEVDSIRAINKMCSFYNKP